jgi:hypothetical protein
MASQLLPYKLGPVTIRAAIGPASSPGRLFVTETCEVCGAGHTGEVADWPEALTRAANNVAKYLCPERGHGGKLF